MSGLECSHCGQEPIDPDPCPDCDGAGGPDECPGGGACGGSGQVYWEDTGEACQCCGFPGSVHVDDGRAYWVDHDWDELAHCNDPACETCAYAWAVETWHDRLVDQAEVSE